MIELVLAIGLIAILAAVLGVATASGTGELLDEGVSRFETMLRLARADAANEGRRIRLRINDTTDLPATDTTTDAAGYSLPPFEIQWEPQPLAEPGQYVPYDSRSWPRQIPVEQVRVIRSERTGDSAYQLLTYGQEQVDNDRLGTDSDAPLLHAITFQSDGQSDSATIELISTDDNDTRTAIIEIDGLTGVIKTRVFTATELAEYRAEDVDE